MDPLNIFFKNLTVGNCFGTIVRGFTPHLLTNLIVAGDCVVLIIFTVVMMTYQVFES